jgi:hypothetical protein
MSLAGHVSKKMLERYSHIRTRRKRAAIEALHASRPEYLAEGAQIGETSRRGQNLANSGIRVGLIAGSVMGPITTAKMRVRPAIKARIAIT